jgi:hypothetical protein
MANHLPFMGRDNRLPANVIVYQFYHLINRFTGKIGMYVRIREIGSRTFTLGTPLNGCSLFLFYSESEAFFTNRFLPLERNETFSLFYRILE